MAGQSKIPKKRKSDIGSLIVSIRQSLKRTAQSIIESGRLLYELKSSVTRQEFLIHLKCDIGISEKQSRRFMNVYLRFANVDISDFENIKSSVLYELAESVDQETAMHLIAGGSITVAGHSKTLEDIKLNDFKKIKKKIERFDLERSIATLMEEIQDEVQYLKLRAAKRRVIQEKNQLRSYIGETIECLKVFRAII